jgi:hypothetical protein
MGVVIPVHSFGVKLIHYLSGNLPTAQTLPSSWVTYSRKLKNNPVQSSS